ncbi:hypothetical protein FSU_2644 [Fibrobacter succinogenes subsp. succinogenes S85]|uniref:MetA-pathway of phenol degradation n=1 Tax=Fibrobacter succinogenes (strain ATCC 19169 / S85) TaxID=59374 RepID=C9RJI4_FIBSS|nr:transporter [Fibrobacter succinogenes]ACX75701.1 hypothetical protein Fisuc_2114 [Fibrobacter succinogenes subsp. succinogenes S85]ADL25639.1 hypothetical protein FSU_2644 [Fibrobacter succinogenes subsp. succinogenes S85]
MLKKAFLAATLCATASFATWDKFPVLEDHKGEIVVGTEFVKQGEPMKLVPYIGSRYTVMPNLELGVILPYYVNLNINNENGLANPVFMARYQFMPMLNAFLDVQVPISNDPYNNSEWSFCFGAQYSQNLGVVDFGAELGLTVNTRGDDKISPPLRLNLGVETDFNLGIPLTPFIGADMFVWIGKFTYEGENVGKSHTGDLAVRPYAGLKYAITPNVSVQASALTLLGKEEVVGPDTPIKADLKLKMSF